MVDGDIGLEDKEIEQAEERSAVGAHIVWEAIRREGDEELQRSSAALLWSGIAAGLSMGFSLVVEGLLASHLPDTEWRPLISKLGYTVGFVVVVLGRQQLFTENTLTVVLPLLARRDRATLSNVSRLWAIVLIANLVGAILFATACAKTSIFDAHTKDVFVEIASKSLEAGFGTTLLRGIFAGWLIALMVWLLPGSESGRLGVVVFIAYIVGLGGFAHVIAGSVEVCFLVAMSKISVGRFFGSFFVPALLGNVLGGVSLVAALNHAQVTAGGRKRASA